MKLTFTDIIRDQWAKPLTVENADLSGRSIIVVGANMGIGFDAVKHFANMNPGRIIMACRNEAKGKAAIEALKKETGHTRLELWLLDLSKFSSVIEFADRFNKDGGRLDLLIMNAAILVRVYEATPDQWESTIQVNHLSTSLLSLLLLPHLLKTAREAPTTPRLVIVSSDVHYLTAISKEEQDSPNILEKFRSEEYCTPPIMAIRYAVSKLLNVLFTRALNARIHSSTPLIVNTANPGYCATTLRRTFSFPLNIFDWVLEKTLATTSEEGSRQLVYAAIGGRENETQMRGAFIAKSEIREVSDFVLSEEGVKVQDRIWKETIDILSQISPKVQDIVREHLQEI